MVFQSQQAVSWSDDTLNELNLIAANIAYSNISEGPNPFAAMGGALDVLATGGDLLRGNSEVSQQLQAISQGLAASSPSFGQRALVRKSIIT